MEGDPRYHPDFPADLSAATEYFDGISLNLGNRFRDAVRQKTKAIAKRPESFGLIHGNIRLALVDGFPYVIVFETLNDLVALLGIFHAASDRTGWFGRSLI